MSRNVFVMVSGPAASGKSTLVKKMGIELPAYIYRPSQAYIELAIEKNIPIDRAFYDIKPSDAENRFCEVCSKNSIVVGDQHLTIQHYKDSMIASKKSIVDFPDEPYVSAINYEIFNKLSDKEIRTLVLYLKASPEVLYERARQRFIDDGTFMRNKNISEVEAEVEAEEYYFNELINSVNVQSCIINTDGIDSNKILEKAIQKTLIFKS